MRLAFPVRSALIAVAVITLGVAYVSDRWRRGDYEFQKLHARLADGNARQINGLQARIKHFQPHAVQGHTCDFCRGWPPGEAEKEVADAQRRLAAAIQEMNYHLRLAGPAGRNHERAWL
jgi:hypothetical protein